MNVQQHNPHINSGLNQSRSYVVDLGPDGQRALYFNSDKTMRFNEMYGCCAGTELWERVVTYALAF
eukprot:4001545-Pyramimonas_sp.AAC.2